MDTYFKGDNTIKLLLPPFLKGINSKRKEFAPKGANSSLVELTLLQ